MLLTLLCQVTSWYIKNRLYQYVCRFSLFYLQVFPFKLFLSAGLPFQTVPMYRSSLSNCPYVQVLPFKLSLCTGPPFQTITLCRSSLSNYSYLQFFPFKLDLSACLPFQTLYLQFFAFKLDLSACLPFQTLYLKFFPFKLDLHVFLFKLSLSAFFPFKLLLSAGVPFQTRSPLLNYLYMQVFPLKLCNSQKRSSTVVLKLWASWVPPIFSSKIPTRYNTH